MDSNTFEKKELNNEKKASFEKKENFNYSSEKIESKEAEINQAKEDLSDVFEEEHQISEDSYEVSENILLEKKLNNYIVRVFSEGSEKVMNEVRKTNDPYLIDAFHDRLLKELRTRKFIK